MADFKIGDKVFRARGSFHYGGNAKDVPMRTKGIVAELFGEDGIRVVFDSGISYRMHSSELEHQKETKPKGAVLTYKPGTSIGAYVKALLGKEKNKERRKWLQTFDNCVLPKKVKDTVNEALTLVLRKDVFDKWGINDHFEKGLTNSILIYGPSGTGKTMISESIAAVLGKNLMKLSSGDIQSQMPGQTERNIKKAFEQAASDDCVLLLDECDSILSDRNMVGAVMGAEINALLTEIENFDGVVLMTTNRLNRLDAALQRRIIAKVELAEPTEEARKMIWQKLIPPKMPIEKLNYDELAEAHLTGGEIKNCILLSARKAIARNKPKVTMHHFTEAIVSVLESKRDYAEAQPIREEMIVSDKRSVLG